MAEPRWRRRWGLIAGLVGALAMPAAADVTTGDVRAPLDDAAALGDSGPSPVSELHWELNAVEPDATELVRETDALALLPASTEPTAPAEPVEVAATPAARSPSPRDWTPLIQIGAAPVVLLVGGLLLLWYARQSGRRRRRSGPTRRRAS